MALSHISYNLGLVPGDLDPTFNGDGKVTISFGSGTDAAYSIAIQQDGKIVAEGIASNENGNYLFALAKYNTDGSLDISFGQDGKVTTSFGGTNDEGRSIAIQQNGKIIAAGFSNVNGNSSLH